MNFLIFGILWFLSGLISCIIKVFDFLEKDDSIDIEDCLKLFIIFLLGPIGFFISLLELYSNHKHKVIFQKKPKK